MKPTLVADGEAVYAYYTCLSSMQYVCLAGKPETLRRGCAYTIQPTTVIRLRGIISAGGNK